MNKKTIILTLLGVFALCVSAQAGSWHKQDSTSTATAGSEIFENSPEIDAKKALYGRIRGLHVSQGTGTSATNEASLQLYGKTPLIIVDGYVGDLSGLTTSEIESVSVLTDAASSAIYGIRGANGVILVTTKRGIEGKMKVTADYHMGVNTQFRSPEFADSYTYANAMNQALVNDGLDARYNSNELEAFRTGRLPMEFANVNWWNEVYQNPGFTHQMNLTFSGGNDRFRYFTLVNYYNDQSMLISNQSDDRYDSQTRDVRLSLRSNLDVKLTETTLMSFNLLGRLVENNGANTNMSTFYKTLYSLPSAAFPIRHYDGTYGGNLTYQDKNPVAVLRDSGHNKDVYGKLHADLTLNQDLSAIAEGLKATIGISFANQGVMYEKSVKTYAYKYHDAEINGQTGALNYLPTVWGSNSAVLDLTNQSFKGLEMETNFKAQLAYDNTFGKHQINAAATYDQYSYNMNGRNASQKRQAAILTAGYSYDNRYMIDAVASWSGSAYLPDGDKFRFYPAVSAAWIISNEGFLKNSSWMNFLRLHGSYGLSGWDGNLSHELWRSSYISSGNFMFTDSSTSYGMAEGGLPVVGLTAEKSKKATAGIDATMFGNRLNVSAEGFLETRSDILVTASNSVSGIIGIQVGKVNAGINAYKGGSVSFDWSDKIRDFEYGFGGNWTYVTSEIINNNQAYEQWDYLYQKGNKVNQCYGLEAIGFFGSQMEINNSPRQTFSTVRPGDVKYKDQNGDNVIDSKDVVKMCGSSTPEVYFGFNVNLGYKGFKVSADFQGATAVTVNLLNSPLYKPLIDNGTISDTFLGNEIPWTVENKADATMPRLTSMANANNYQNSSLWYRDGSFIKLRNLTVSYTFPRSMIRFADMQVYLKGTNLFSLDNIGFADPEQLAATYPSVRSFWAGVKFNF